MGIIVVMFVAIPILLPAIVLLLPTAVVLVRILVATMRATARIAIRKSAGGPQVVAHAIIPRIAPPHAQSVSAAPAGRAR